MNDSTGVVRRPRHPLRRRGLPAAAVVATAVLALAACSSGGSPSSTGGSPHAGGSTSSPSAVAYSACMRSHGVPNFPDPDSKGMPGQADPQHLGVSSSRYQAAPLCQAGLPAPAPHRRVAATSNPAVPVVRRLSTDLAAAAPDRRAKVRPVHALPWGCPTRPTPQSAPRAVLSSTSVVPASTRNPRIRRSSDPRKANAGAW